MANLLRALERAETPSGYPDMTVGEAEQYLKELARGGNVEAQKLLTPSSDGRLMPRRFKPPWAAERISGGYVAKGRDRPRRSLMSMVAIRAASIRRPDARHSA